MSESDPAIVYQNLRSATVAMLGLNLVDDLSPVDSLRANLLSILLLELDGLQGEALANRPIDMSRFSTAVGLLGKLMPPTALEPRVLALPPPEGDAREKLHALFAGMERAREFEMAELRAEVDRLRADNERLRAAAVPATPTAPPAAPPPATKPARPVPGLVQRTPEDELARLASREPPPIPASSEGFTPGPTNWYGGRFAAIGGATKRPYGL